MSPLCDVIGAGSREGTQHGGPAPREHQALWCRFHWWWRWRCPGAHDEGRRWRGGRAGLAWPHRLHTLAPARRRPPQEGVEQVTRSMATNFVQVSLEPACCETWDAPKQLATALAAPASTVTERREGWGRRWRSGARHDQGSDSRLHGSDARTCERVTAHKLNRRRAPKRSRTETATQWVRSPAGCGQVSGPTSDTRGSQERGLGWRVGPGPEVSERLEWWPGTDVRGQT